MAGSCAARARGTDAPDARRRRGMHHGKDGEHGIREPSDGRGVRSRHPAGACRCVAGRRAGGQRRRQRLDNRLAATAHPRRFVAGRQEGRGLLHLLCQAVILNAPKMPLISVGWIDTSRRDGAMLAVMLAVRRILPEPSRNITGVPGTYRSSWSGLVAAAARAASSLSETTTATT